MDFIYAIPSTTEAPHPNSRFKKPIKASKATLHLPHTPAQPLREKEPYEGAIEALRLSFSAVMEKLDRIEAKVDLLANKAE